MTTHWIQLFTYFDRILYLTLSSCAHSVNLLVKMFARFVLRNATGPIISLLQIFASARPAWGPLPVAPYTALLFTRLSGLIIQVWGPMDCELAVASYQTWDTKWWSTRKKGRVDELAFQACLFTTFDVSSFLYQVQTIKAKRELSSHANFETHAIRK